MWDLDTWVRGQFACDVHWDSGAALDLDIFWMDIFRIDLVTVYAR